MGLIKLKDCFEFADVLLVKVCVGQRPGGRDFIGDVLQMRY